jgi:hypothetical protein
MPLIKEGGATLWRRDPMQQNIARDLIGMTATYMRACTVSREYSIVKVPITHYDVDSDQMTLDLSKHSEDERRFVLENITPREFDAMNGAKLPPVDRSR